VKMKAVHRRVYKVLLIAPLVIGALIATVLSTITNKFWTSHLVSEIAIPVALFLAVLLSIWYIRVSIGRWKVSYRTLEVEEFLKDIFKSLLGLPWIFIVVIWFLYTFFPQLLHTFSPKSEEVLTGRVAFVDNVDRGWRSIACAKSLTITGTPYGNQKLCIPARYDLSIFEKDDKIFVIGLSSYFGYKWSSWQYESKIHHRNE